MALEYKTVVNSIALGRAGEVTVRLGLLVVDGDREVAATVHGYAAGAEEDPLAYLDEVIADIATRGYPAPSAEDMKWLSDVAALRKGAPSEAPEGN